MICKKCGELLEDGARVCPLCGARQRSAGGSKLNPTHVDYHDCAHEERPRKKRPAAHREDLSGLLILIGVLLLILGGPSLLVTLAGNWGSPRMFLLAGVVIAGVILVRIGLSLYKRK